MKVSKKKNVVQDIVTYLLIIKHTTFSQSAYSYDILHNKVKIPKGNIYIQRKDDKTKENTY